ncbi:MAG: hypothetical protein ABI183_26840 [Polyangiaceae bacterium]
MGTLRNLRLGTAALLSLTTLVVACSSSSSGSSVSADQAATDVAAAFCNKYNSCAPPFVQVAYGDLTTCEARFKLSVAPSLAANGTGATSAQYESCSKDLATASCDDLLSRNLPQSCHTIAGTLANGAACGEDSQCTGKYCNTEAGSTCGACSTIAAAGGACTSDDGCDYGLTCENSICTAYGAAGATCDVTHNCTATLACVNGTCATPLEAGAACPAIGAPGCDTLKGLYCNTSKVCATYSFANAGQPCGLVSAQSYAACAGGGLCKGASGITPGTCEAPAADGASCDAAAGPSCLAPAVCTGGVCKITDPSTCK